MDAVAAGLLPTEIDEPRFSNRSKSGMQQRGQREQSIRKTTEQPDDMGGGGCVCGLSEEKVAQVIRSTQPGAPGERNRAVFKLAQTLKGEAALCDAEPTIFRPIVERWHKMAFPVIRTKPFEETWIDFLKGWPKVKYPKGARPMDVIFEQAKASNPPEWATRYEQPELRQLVTLCRELQRNAGDGPFFLGCRTAGRLLDVNHATASRWLFLLRSEGVLRELEKGKKGGGRYRATRYRYVADDDSLSVFEPTT